MSSFRSIRAARLAEAKAAAADAKTAAVEARLWTQGQYALYSNAGTSLTTWPMVTAQSNTTVTITWSNMTSATTFDYWAPGETLWHSDPDALLVAGEPQARRVSASDRALDLFRSVITPEQLGEYERTGSITVRSPSGRRYHVNCSPAYGRHGNIKEIDREGKQLASICVAPGGPIPHYDAILGQIIALQHDEHALRQAANFTPLVLGYDRNELPRERAA